MATGAFTLYDSAIKEFFNGTQDWDTDAHRCVLLTSSYTPSAAHDTYSDISTYVTADGDYAPQDMTGEAVTVSSSVTICDADDVSFGASVTITARYCAIVVGTVAGSSGTDRLVGYMLLDNTPADVSSSAAPFRIAWDNNGIFRVSQSAAVEITTPAGITTDDADFIDFAAVAAADANTVLYLAPCVEFPGMRDYASTFTDAELCDASSLASSGSRGLMPGNVVLSSSFPAKAGLVLASQGVWRHMYKVINAGTVSTGYHYDHSASGETEAANFTYSCAIYQTTGKIRWLTETGAGVNSQADWRCPRPTLGEEYLVEMRRDTVSDVRCYVNGLQMSRVDAVSGATDNGDGSAEVFTSGGTNGQLCLSGTLGANDPDIDLYFLHIVNNEASAATAAAYAVGKKEWSAAQLDMLQRDVINGAGADVDCVIAFYPNSGGTITDAVGNITTWSAEGITLCSKLWGDTYWTESGDGTNTASGTPAACRITGDLSLNVLAMYDGSSCSFVATYASGETEADNILYGVGVTSTTVLKYFHEYSTGTDHSTTWTLAETLAEGIVYEVRITRTDNGDGTCDLRAWQRTLTSTTWTALAVASSTTGDGGAGTSTIDAGATNPSGGGSGQVVVQNSALGIGGDDHPWREISVYDAIKTPS